MGQPITYLRTTAPRPGLVRFELNRSLTGMGHERYLAGAEILGNRPCDVLARRLFGVPGVAMVHIYSHMVTVELDERGPSGIEDVIRELYTYYLPGVEIPSDEELMAMVE
jgi:hypothetical protein